MNTESFDFAAFNVGNYYRSVEQKVVSENLTKVLYPNDEPAVGKRLRLEQQYFFVSCSLQDIIRMHVESGGSLAGHAEASRLAGEPIEVTGVIEDEIMPSAARQRGWR